MSRHYSEVVTSDLVTHQFGSHDRKCRSRLEVMASQTKAVATEEHFLRPRQEGLPKKIMSRHRFEVTTQKEDIVGRNREIMSRP